MYNFFIRFFSYGFGHTNTAPPQSFRCVGGGMIKNTFLSVYTRPRRTPWKIRLTRYRSTRIARCILHGLGVSVLTISTGYLTPGRIREWRRPRKTRACGHRETNYLYYYYYDYTTHRINNYYYYCCSKRRLRVMVVPEELHGQLSLLYAGNALLKKVFN